eukprot:4981246-Amphidinium_carterae.1
MQRICINHLKDLNPRGCNQRSKLTLAKKNQGQRHIRQRPTGCDPWTGPADDPIHINMNGHQLEKINVMRLQFFPSLSRNISSKMDAAKSKRLGRED